jgi:hypothetical protein
VVRWYREHNYNFVAVTDLNYYTLTEGLKALFDAPGRFLVLSPAKTWFSRATRLLIRSASA